MSHIPQYTMLRGGSLVYNRRVPKHAQDGFGAASVRVRLGNDQELASLLAVRLTEKLDQLWASTLVHPIDVVELVASLKPRATTFVDALETYIADKNTGRAPNFEGLVRRLVSIVPEAAGNKLIADYDRDDARAVMRAMHCRGFKTGTIRRRLNAIQAVMEHAYIEADVQRRNPFSRLTIPGEGADVKKRQPFSEKQLQDAYKHALDGKSAIKQFTLFLIQFKSCPELKVNPTHTRKGLHPFQEQFHARFPLFLFSLSPLERGSDMQSRVELRRRYFYPCGHV